MVVEFDAAAETLRLRAMSTDELAEYCAECLKEIDASLARSAAELDEIRSERSQAYRATQPALAPRVTKPCRVCEGVDADGNWKERDGRAVCPDCFGAEKGVSYGEDLGHVRGLRSGPPSR